MNERSTARAGGLKDAALLGRRQLELIEGATKVFAARGFDATTVGEIAEECGWSIGALYRYVSSKDDILYLVCEDIFRTIGVSSLADIHATQPTERLRLALDTYCESSFANRAKILLLYREYGRLSPAAQQHFKAEERKSSEVFAQIVRDGIATGEFECADPGLFGSHCILMGHSFALKSWAFGGRSLTDVKSVFGDWALKALEPEAS